MFTCFTTMEEFVSSANNSEALPIVLLIAGIIAVVSLATFLLSPTEPDKT